MKYTIPGLVRAKHIADVRQPLEREADNTFVNQQSERFYRSHPASRQTTGFTPVSKGA